MYVPIIAGEPFDKLRANRGPQDDSFENSTIVFPQPVKPCPFKPGTRPFNLHSLQPVCDSTVQQSTRSDSLTLARGTIDRLNHCETSPALLAIAHRRAARLDALHKIFENSLMPANVAHYRRVRAGILIYRFSLMRVVDRCLEIHF